MPEHPPELDPYALIGGREPILAMAERFYDLMEEREPELARLHELDESGRVARGPRERFGLFLVGWLGGPQEYMARHGHPRLRMRHARVPVDVAMRDAWVRCMLAAMESTPMPESLRSFLEVRFAEVADFLRNVDEPG
jgi:hemoglobin